MTKTEEQIEKDKEAVSKMIGAKSAMEAAIRHIDQLESVIKQMKTAHNECMKAVGTDAVIKAYRANDGSYRTEQNLIRVHTISDWVNTIADKATR